MPMDQTQQNIRVAVRCRPMNKNEKEKAVTTCVSCTRDKVTVKERNATKVFTFDQVFNPYSKQIELYNSMVAPVVEEILLGYNCTIFAYGQTGSGKTFTMTGERTDKLRYAWEDDPMVGVIPRALSHLFDKLEKRGADFSVRVSFLEVYNEELFDLLAVTEASRLTIYDDVNRKGSVIVKGLREIVVFDKDNVHSVIERGLAKRQTASTLLNAQSSRSHSIFTVTVHIKEAHPITGEELLRIGKLHLVDLAGSESIGRSGAVDKRAREAGSINQSLLTLGRVITALVDHAPHVPYRESKLTRLLQDSLGGKTKTSIIATISPGSNSLEETLSTLDYAHRAKNIENRPEVNVRMNKTDMVRGYNEELERLRRDLEAARTKTGIYVDTENYQLLQAQIKQQRERICELEERRETHENEMTQLQEVFSLTQSELIEVQDRQQKVENELVACQTDLEVKEIRLLKLKFRLEEEEHLREQHEHTEGVLREQAESLLTTTRCVIGDVGALHGKIDRMSELDEANRQRLAQLPNTWAVERLSGTRVQLSGLTERVELYCQQIRNELSNLRSQNEETTSDLLQKQTLLKQELATCLSQECLQAATQTDEFASQQIELSRECLEGTLRPQSQRILALHSTLHSAGEKMEQLLQSHNDIVRASHDQVTSMVNQLTVLMQHCTDFSTNQKQRYAGLRQQWEEHSTRQTGLTQTVLTAMADLEAQHQATQKLIAEKLDVDETNFSTWHRTHTDSLTNIHKELLTTTQKASQQHETFHTASQACAYTVVSDMSQLGKEQETLLGKADACLDSLCTRATTFSTHGLGAQLRHRADQWKVESVPESDHASVQLEGLVNTTGTGMKQLTDLVTEKALVMENLSGNVLYEATNGFSMISTDLAAMPADLNAQLAQDLQHYLPSGQTPQQRAFSYPEQLAKTAPHMHLRRAFRAMQRQQGYDSQIPLTPLLQDTSIISSDNQAILSSPGKENIESPESEKTRDRTSDLGSESTVSGVLKELPDAKLNTTTNSADVTPQDAPIPFEAVPPLVVQSAPTTPYARRPKPRTKKVPNTRR